VHRQLVVLQVVLARGPEGRVGNKKPTQKNPKKTTKNVFCRVF
jgi:hypothetical protein